MASNIDADPKLLEGLIEFGVQEADAKAALKGSGNKTIDAALEW
jgi:hypothetical protein